MYVNYCDEALNGIFHIFLREMKRLRSQTHVGITMDEKTPSQESAPVESRTSNNYDGLKGTVQGPNVYDTIQEGVHDTA